MQPFGFNCSDSVIRLFHAHLTYRARQIYALFFNLKGDHNGLKNQVLQMNVGSLIKKSHLAWSKSLFETKQVCVYSGTFSKLANFKILYIK